MKLLVIIALVVVPGCASTLPGRGDPTAATAAFSRAIAHQLQGRHDDAIQEYDQAIRLRPEYAEASTTAAQPTTASANTTGRSRISNAPTKVDHCSRRPSRSARARSASTTLPDRIWTDCPDPASDEERQRLLDQFRKAAKELSAPGAVEGAVVAREGQHHGRLHSGLAVERNDAVGDTPHGEDGRLWRVDDRVERVDAVHPEVADRESPALDVGRTQLAGLGPAHDVLAARRELRQTQRVGAMDDGDHEAVVDRDGQTDVDVGGLDDRAILPRGVHARVLGQGRR